MTVRPVCVKDISACLDIYNFYICQTAVTFEETPLTEQQFGERVRRIIGDGYPYFVAEEQGRVIGYAYLDMYSPRSAYRYTADLSIYVRADHTGRGVGCMLYEHVESAAIESGLRNIISVITESNRSSIDFHEKHGFRCVGVLPGVGYKFDRWLGVVIYQKVL